MIRSIVCGVARDRNDCTTLKVAARLADRVGARLVVVTVVPAPAEAGRVREAAAEGRAAVAQVARQCAIVDDAVHRVEIGEPVEGLARASEDADAELIVVGGTRRSGIGSLLRPGVAQLLARRSGRSVAIVPARAADDDDAVRLLAAGAQRRSGPVRAGRRADVGNRLAFRLSGHAPRPVVRA